MKKTVIATPGAFVQTIAIISGREKRDDDEQGWEKGGPFIPDLQHLVPV